MFTPLQSKLTGFAPSIASLPLVRTSNLPPSLVRTSRFPHHFWSQAFSSYLNVRLSPHSSQDVTPPICQDVTHSYLSGRHTSPLVRTSVSQPPSNLLSGRHASPLVRTSRLPTCQDVSFPATLKSLVRTSVSQQPSNLLSGRCAN
ncbi:hypothetical protein BgiMline_021052 [Biomphalaria glabrata]|nr:hypothetical protein BgiMline_018211 [Biomphalaria glabrata]